MITDEFPRSDAFLSEELLRIALDSSGIAVWKIDPRARSIEWTAALRQMLGPKAEQPTDFESFLACVHPDDSEHTTQGVAKALDPAGDGRCEVEFRVVTPNDDIRWMIANGRAFFEGAGANRQATLCIGTLRDVTARKAVEATLQAAIDHKQILLQEINHRVKNSLQLVSSLLRLQSRRITDPALRHQLDDATTRISTIAHIHQRLYRDQDIKRINFGAFLSELCADVQGASPECSLAVNSPHISLPTDKAIPLALIANELVNNAFKYAYPDRTGGPVSITVNQPEQGQIAICVSDDGVGLPEGFGFDKTESLGMVLIGSLLGQLGGKIETPDRGKGATFIVTAPIEEIASA